MRSVVLAFFALAMLTACAAASIVQLDPWQFESNLSDNESMAILSSLSFRLNASLAGSWVASSDKYQFSSPSGDIESSAWLSQNCDKNPQAKCSDYTYLYSQQNGRIEKIGKLSFKNQNIFKLPSDAPAEPMLPVASSNHASTDLGISPPPAPQLLSSLPTGWLSVIAFAIVAAITFAYVLRNKY